MSMCSKEKTLIFCLKPKHFLKKFNILTRHLSLFKVILTTLKREQADNLWSKCLQTTHSIGQTYITCQSYTEKWKEKTTVQRISYIHVSFLCARYATRELQRIIFLLWIKINKENSNKEYRSFQYVWKKSLLSEGIPTSVSNNAIQLERNIQTYMLISV